MGSVRSTTPRTVPRRRRSRAGVVPVAAALALLAGLLQLASGPAVAADSADSGEMPSVTLTGPHREWPRAVALAAADGTGYLSAGRDVGPGSLATWVGYDGSTRSTPAVHVYAYNGGFGLEGVPGTSNVYQIRRYSTGAVTRFSLSPDDRVSYVFAENRLLVSRRSGGSGRSTCWRCRREAGSRSTGS